jgi:hypothetical protein
MTSHCALPGVGAFGLTPRLAGGHHAGGFERRALTIRLSPRDIQAFRG